MLAWERATPCSVHPMRKVESKELYREGPFYANVPAESS
jgi:hypothetical protein